MVTEPGADTEVAFDSVYWMIAWPENAASGVKVRL
jgi:hypothetical protein